MSDDDLMVERAEMEDEVVKLNRKDPGKSIICGLGIDWSGSFT